jgi:hypothetical protein
VDPPRQPIADPDPQHARIAQIERSRADLRAEGAGRDGVPESLGRHVRSSGSDPDLEIGSSAAGAVPYRRHVS